MSQLSSRCSRHVRACLIFSLLGGLIAAPVAADQATIPGVEVERLARSSQSWNGHPLPAYRPEQPEITLLRFRIAPGARLPLHQHPVINAGVLLSGELTVESKAGEILHLKAGEALIELVGELHFGYNAGTEPVDLIVFYAGNVEQPIMELADGAAGHD
ncbi:cupin domain-containing protein [Allochromatium vinosum]|uniref:cupin domain-containing protein n=1 Tax=Allochromatium vinosum TaxID=1049 RepID=UPI0019044CFD|nr:cupin domain-containing protein [Allochromatium vinosum]MBK1655126.1 cupin [Allochromatium vinosum]